MINIAAHVRIFDPEPEDDLVVKRTAAIKDLSSRYSKKQTVEVILQRANDLARAVEVKGKLSETLAEEIEIAVFKYAEAFVAKGQATDDSLRPTWRTEIA